MESKGDYEMMRGNLLISYAFLLLCSQFYERRTTLIHG